MTMNGREFGMFLGAAVAITGFAGIRNVENYVDKQGCRVITLEYGSLKGKIGLAVCERTTAMFIKDYFEKIK